MPTTLFEKIWDAHEVIPNLIWIDLHLVHEVTSPQAFDGLRLAGRQVRRPDRTLATADHNVPTDGSTVAAQIRDQLSRVQVETLERLSMEGRMTICNMTIEGGGRAGMIAPDETTFEWIEGKPAAPKDFEAAVERWRELRTDEGASFDREVEVDASELSPQVTWGTTPEMVAPVTGAVPEPSSEGEERALKYMDLRPGMAIQEIPLDRVFIGSCTNSRIGDLRAAASMIDGRRVASSVHAMVVPGSQQVKAQAEAEGLDEVFRRAGFDWRSAGCSMCLGMNPDTLSPGERCASTSNRNFEGRQGRGGRTHLVSPEMAAAASIEGHFVDIREWEPAR